MSPHTCHLSLRSAHAGGISDQDRVRAQNHEQSGQHGITQLLGNAL
jgi:hypothetical protein